MLTMNPNKRVTCGEQTLHASTSSQSLVSASSGATEITDDVHRDEAKVDTSNVADSDHSVSRKCEMEAVFVNEKKSPPITSFAEVPQPSLASGFTKEHENDLCHQIKANLMSYRSSTIRERPALKLTPETNGLVAGNNGIQGTNSCESYLSQATTSPLLMTSGVSIASIGSCTGPLPFIRHPNDRDGVTNKNTTVPEFLYQLVKMLAENNKEVIEWSNGNIVVHNPPKLATDVLGKYFRHSKYSSFQRQLNYFGFRKTAGKGKMAPCRYENDEVTGDIRSLLSIKRKPHGVTGGRGKNCTAEKQKKKSDDEVKTPHTKDHHSEFRSMHKDSIEIETITSSPLESDTRRLEISQTNPISPTRRQPETNVQGAASRGVRHRFNGYLKGEPAKGENDVLMLTQQDNLLEHQMSFEETTDENECKILGPEDRQQLIADSITTFSRDTRTESISSLVDLAMIPPAPSAAKENQELQADSNDEEGFNFIDFPCGNFSTWNQ